MCKHWRETSLINVTSVETYKGNRRRCRRPRTPVDSPLVMPANKDIASDTMLGRVEPGRTNSFVARKASGKLSHTSESSSTTVLPEHANGVEKQNGVRTQHFRSVPNRDVHEKLFRDFFELVLQQAVFEVSLSFYICQLHLLKI